METESTAITAPSTLLEELVERTRLSPLQLTVVVELVLITILVGTAYLDGVLAHPFNADFRRAGLIWPVIIAYALLTLPLSRGWRDGAIKAFRPLVPLDDDDFHLLLTEASIFNRRREWLALGISAGSTLLLSRPILSWASMGRSGWLLALVAFFLNMRSVHGDMVESKMRELQMVRGNLMRLFQALKERTAQGEIEDTRELLDSIKAWTAHEEWVRKLPEWPYTGAIKRNLALSLFPPVVVGIIREALSGFLRKLVPLP